VRPPGVGHGETAESLAAKEAELQIAVSGIDDIWMQTVHASHRYMHHQIAWGRTLADVISETAEELVIDMTRFHDVEPAE
jgi:hypothetical protein